MDIRHLNSGQLREQAASRKSLEAEANQDQAPARGAIADRADAGDGVKLSKDAAALAEVTLGQSEPAFDQSRVDAIRLAISEGRYHVDPERLASNFARIESQLEQ